MDHANIEPVARSICEREMRASPHFDPAGIPALVERYWQVIAAQIVAGLRDDDGRLIEHDAATGIAAWEDWLEYQVMTATPPPGRTRDRH